MTKTTTWLTCAKWQAHEIGMKTAPASVAKFGRKVVRLVNAPSITFSQLCLST